MGYTYNCLGQLTSATHPSGRVISYGFDGAARLISVGFRNCISHFPPSVLGARLNEH